jgi:hypothetical protein
LKQDWLITIRKQVQRENLVIYLDKTLVFQICIRCKNVEVMFLNDRDQIIRITRTNEYRDFVFEKLDTTENYRLMILIKKMPFDQAMDGINRTQAN